MVDTLYKYVIRGQLYEAYAVHPDPKKEGRSHGFFVSTGSLACVRQNAKTRYGWKLVAASPSTKLMSKLIHGR